MFFNSDEIVLRPADPGRPPAVIAGASQTGVLGMRSLKRRGVNVICVDSRPDFPGFRSVYGKARLCPNPDLDPPVWLKFMKDLAEQFGKRPVLIPSSDQFIIAIAGYAADLRQFYTLSPGIELQGELAEKFTQYRLARQHRFPMPRTMFAESEEKVAEFAGETSFPCLLKPNHFREWQKLPRDNPFYGKKISISHNRTDLLKNYRWVSDVTPNVILQEIIEGPDTAKRVYLSCYNSIGKRIANAMFRELRCDPLGFGPASVSEPVDDPEVDVLCDTFLKKLDYRGICEIEIKRDSRDGKPKLIEINPRLSGGGDAAPYAGVDLPWIHYCDLTGEPVNTVEPNGKNFKHIVVRADARAVPAYLKAGLISWQDVLRSYRPPLAFYDIDWRDWRNTLETIVISGRSFLQGMLSNHSAGNYRV